MRQCRTVLETLRDDLQTALENCSLTALCSHTDGSTDSVPIFPLVFRKDRFHRVLQELRIALENTELAKVSYPDQGPFNQITRGNIYTSQVIPNISSALLLVNARRACGEFPLGIRRKLGDRRCHLCSKLCGSL